MNEELSKSGHDGKCEKDCNCSIATMFTAISKEKTYNCCGFNYTKQGFAVHKGIRH